MAEVQGVRSRDSEPGAVARRVHLLLDSWVDGVGRVSFWMFLLTVPFIAVDAALINGTGDECNERDENCRIFSPVRPVLFTLLVALEIFSAFCLGTFLASIGHLRRKTRWRAEWVPRLQSAKEWYVSGRLDKPTYQAFESRAVSIQEGRFAGARWVLSGRLMTAWGWALVFVGALATYPLMVKSSSGAAQLGSAFLIAAVIGVGLVIGSIPVRITGNHVAGGFLAETVALEGTLMDRARGA